MRKYWLSGFLIPYLFGAGTAFGQIPTPGHPVMMGSPAPGQPVVMESAIASEMGDKGSGGQRFWVDGEYLLWWIKSGGVSTPLVTTTSNPFATNNAGFFVGGALDAPGTIPLFGGDNNKALTYGATSGGRFSTGLWLDSDASIAIWARGFFLAPQSVTKTYVSGPDGNPVVGLPVVDAAGIAGGGENIWVASFPGVGVGGDTINYTSRLWGGEGNFLMSLMREESLMLNGVAGFRYLGLNESLSVTTNNLGINGNPVSFLGSPFIGSVGTYDQWKTSNRFYGGQLGFQSCATLGNFFVNLNAVCGLGSTVQVLTTNGFSTLSSGNIAAVAPGGIYVQPSNFGRYSRSVFSVVPELEFKLGMCINSNIRAWVGYNFLYWSNVIRPGDQVDRRVDFRTVPTTAFFAFNPAVTPEVPAPLFRSTDFWAQGVTFGLQLSF